MVGLADFHHVELSVANASQSAYWFCCCFGFHRFARKENEKQVSVAIRNGKVIFIFTSLKEYSKWEREQYILHGDNVRDVAFRVDDLASVVNVLESQGIELITPSTSIEDEDGAIQIARIRSQDTNVLHTLIRRNDYRGTFLPGYKDIEDFPIGNMLPELPLVLLDHVVHTSPVGTIEETAEWYKKALSLNRFWSVDDYEAKSEHSAINAWLLVNEDKKVQYTLAEPNKDRPGRSQIEEFVDYNGGPGIQHIAFLVDDIIKAVVEMKKRSLEFLTVPDSYYEILRERLSRSKCDFEGDLEKLREQSILMDFDDNGYLLQIFTKPCQDKPTLFIEIIQRNNFDGFGAGNFKSLFEAVEREQKLRGTLL